MEVCPQIKSRARTLPKIRRGDIQEGQACKYQNISKDLEAIQKRALEEGLPYQTLISSLLHKYVSGRLVEKQTLTSR